MPRGIEVRIDRCMGCHSCEIACAVAHSGIDDLNALVLAGVRPEYRIGYAFLPNHRFTFSIDYAIDKNRDPSGEKLDGREIALGFEAGLGTNRAFVFRGGAAMELGGDAPVVYTGGFGLKFKHVFVDFAYATDPDGDSRRLWGGLRFAF